MLLSFAAAILSLIGFLGGLRTMRLSLEGIAEGRLPAILERFVQTPTRGILTGLVTTALVQSSAAITAICVGMVAAETMTFRNTVGVILGANVGSTVTPQLFSLNLWGIAIPCLLFGVIGLITRRDNLHRLSMALVGFALVFIALRTLSLAMHPLSKMPWFTELLRHAGQAPLYAALAGALLSALIQSSTATTMITMALAAERLVPMTGAIGIVLGANVGTCVTSVIAAIGQNRAAKEVALAHVVLNAVGVALVLPFVTPFTNFVTWIGPFPDKQLANAHSIFNIVCTLAVWPFTARFASLIEFLLPNNRKA